MGAGQPSAGPCWPMAAIGALLAAADEATLRRQCCDALTAAVVASAWSLTPDQRRWLDRALGPWAARIGVAAGRTVAHSDGTWQAVPVGPAGERDGVASILVPVWVPDDPGLAGWQVADLVSWPVGRPAAARSLTGGTTVLGIDTWKADIALHDGRPLRLVPDAAAWVRAGGGLADPFDDDMPPAVCVLDWASDDADWLLRMAPALIVADEDEAQALARRRDAWRTRQRPPKTRILIARAAPEERAA